MGHREPPCDPQLSAAKNHDCRHHPRGSVRRASGFVLTGYTEVIVAKSNFTFAAHDVVNIHFHVGFSGKTGIVAAHDDFNARLEGAHQFDNAASSSPSSP